MEGIQQELPVRLKLTIAYDGHRFGGWQLQPNTDTIQERLETALAEIAKEPLRLHGSGRTDSGVHAIGQVAHFDAPDQLTMNPVNWLAALNTRLPATIRVLECEEVANDFHARFSALSKTYHYELSNAPILPPFQAGRVWHLPAPTRSELPRGRPDPLPWSPRFPGLCRQPGQRNGRNRLPADSP